MLIPLRCIASSSKTHTSPLPLLRRPLTTKPTSTLKKYSRPGPPPLPPKDQAEFDALIKANASIGASPAATAPSEVLDQHRDLRRGPRKDFEGEVNPLTGERGGPKIDPFKAGGGDWQYGGRVTDF